MKARIIKTRIWNEDDIFGSYSPLAKLLFIYYITNNRIGMTGAYECSLRNTMFETSMTSKQLELAEIELEDTKKVFRRGSWVFVKNAEKHNRFKGEKNAIAYTNEKNALPSSIAILVNEVSIPNDEVSVVSDTTQYPVISNKKPVTTSYTKKFETFWDAYPKKEKKKQSFAIWKRNGYEKHLPQILEFLQKAKLTDRWVGGFIKQPTAFLNGECWDDDLSAYGETSESKLIIKAKRSYAPKL